MYYCILLLFFSLTTSTLAERKTFNFALVAVSSKVDTTQTQHAKRSLKPTKYQTKPFWKRVGKILLYVVAILAVIYLLGLAVVAALSSMGK